MVLPKRLSIHLLGELRIGHDGVDRVLPQSRKTRGLLAYLALNPRRQRRDALCQLIWDAPNDPRAALRWSLSKLKPLLTDGAGTLLSVDREGVQLDHSRVQIDLYEIRRVLEGTGGGEPSEAALLQLVRELEAGYLPGLDDVGGPEFQLWLQSERDAARKLHRRALDRLIERASQLPAQALPLARKRVVLDPFEPRANIELLRLTLEVAGRSEAQELLARLRARHREEKVSDEALRAAWAELSASHTAQEPATSAAIQPAEVLAPGDPEATARPELPQRPSVAVLGFEELGAHQDGSVLATGLAVDLSSRLSQLPHLFVTARASAVRFAGKQLRPREIGARLGVRYLVDGSAQRHGQRVRVTVSLLEAPTETEVWSEHFDRPLDDLFAVQDEITGAVVAAIEPAIERVEMQRSLLALPDSLNAWECFHRGLWHCFRFTAQDNEHAHELLRKAVALDPRFSRAYAGLSFTHYSRAFLDAAPDIDREIGQALELARKSVDFDGRDSMGHWCLGRALFLSRQHDEALAAIDRSLATNPNYAMGHYVKGFVGIHAGLDQAALPSLAVAQRLSPFDPLLFAIKASRAISLANQGDYEDAAAWGVRATQEPNAHFHIYAIAAACLELAGRSDEARRNAQSVLQQHPSYGVEVFQRSFPHRDEAFRERMLAAMALAGIPRASQRRARGRR